MTEESGSRCWKRSPFSGNCRRKKGHRGHHRDGDGAQWQDDGRIVCPPKYAVIGKCHFWPSIPR